MWPQVQQIRPHFSRVGRQNPRLMDQFIFWGSISSSQFSGGSPRASCPPVLPGALQTLSGLLHLWVPSESGLCLPLILSLCLSLTSVRAIAWSSLLCVPLITSNPPLHPPTLSAFVVHQSGVPGALGFSVVDSPLSALPESMDLN